MRRHDIAAAKILTALLELRSVDVFAQNNAPISDLRGILIYETVTVKRLQYLIDGPFDHVKWRKEVANGQFPGGQTWYTLVVRVV